MPLLTPNQILKLQQIIRDSATALAISTVGYEVPASEVQRLVDEGYLDPDQTDNIIYDSFAFGQLLDQIENAQTMRLPDFEKYLAKNPVKMTVVEKHSYDVAKHRAGNLCVGLGNRFAEKAGQQIVAKDEQLAEKVRDIIKDETAVKIEKRKTRKQLKTELANLTKDYGRDWDRIAHTEAHLAQQTGFFNATVEKHGDGVLLAKVPEPNACPDCKKLYLDADGQPLIKPSTWWLKQGETNIGRKRADWRPVLGVMHPWCRCRLVRVPNGWAFDENGDMVPESMLKKSVSPKTRPHVTGFRGASFDAIQPDHAKKLARKSDNLASFSHRKSDNLSFFHTKNVGDLAKAEQLGLFDKPLAKPESKLTKLPAASKKAAGGPFIGPRGGKWADPQHTIPYEQTEAKPASTKKPSKKKPRGKQIPVPPRGQITKEYMKALSDSFKKLVKPSEKAGTQRDVSVFTAKALKYVNQLSDDLLFSRGLYYGQDVGKPPRIKSKIAQRDYQLKKLKKDLTNRLRTLKYQIDNHHHLITAYHIRFADKGRAGFLSDEHQKLYDKYVENSPNKDHASWQRQAAHQDSEELKAIVSDGLKEINSFVNKIVKLNQELSDREKKRMHIPALRKFSIGNLTVAFEDESAVRNPVRAENTIAQSLIEAKRKLEQKGLGHLWRGDFIVKPFEEPRTDSEWARAADYHWKKDKIRMFSERGLTYTMLHEIGHRYYFKNMSIPEQRRFDHWFGKIKAVSEYGSLDPHEDFAEVFAHYMTDKDIPRPALERFKKFLHKSDEQVDELNKGQIRDNIETNLRQFKDTLEKSRKLHARLVFQDFQISIENRKGSVRHWYDPHTDTKGKTKMLYPYGYIRLTEGTDGDHVDVFIGPNENAKNVYVVHQMKAPSFKEFDEDKCMLGFDSAAEAKEAYLKHFDRPDFFGSMTTMTVDEFRQKLITKKAQMLKAELAHWEKAVKSVGIPMDKLHLVTKWARLGNNDAQQALMQISDEFEKGFGSDTFGSSTFGGDYQRVSISGAPRRGSVFSPVRTMGNYGKPARTAGENVRSDKVGEPRDDWPPWSKEHKKKDRRKKRKLERAAERLDLVGLSRGKGGYAHDEFDYKGMAVVDTNRRVTPCTDARANLEIQQKSRMAYRKGSKLSSYDIHR